MNIPLPPSDNLYKFQAIAGLIGIIVWAVLPVVGLLYTHDKQEAVSAAVAVIEVDINRRVEKTEEIKLEVDALERELDSAKDAKSARSEELIKRMHELRERNEKNWVELLPELRELYGVKAVAEGNRYRAELFHEIFRYSLLPAAASVLYMFLGFRRWYSRVQKYEDILLKARADAMTEPKPTTASAPRVSPWKRAALRRQRAG